MPDIDEEFATRKIIQLPPRRKGEHSSTFSEKRIISNHYFVDLKQIERITIFSVKFHPKIPQDNSKLRNQLLSDILPKLSTDIKKPVISGMNIYSTSDYSGEELTYTSGEYEIKVKKVKLYDLSKNPNLLLTFLNNSLRNIMRKLNYVQIGKSGKYFNAKDKTLIDNLNMYNGYKSNFVSLQKGYFLRVDAAKKIVRNETVLQFIDGMYAQHREKPKEEKRMLVKSAVIGLTVMSNYGKTNYYRISDVQFNDLESVVFDDSEIKLTDYYKDKYKITIRSLKQPLLVAEGKDKTKPILLIPELMLMTGIPENFDEMRRKKISQQTIKNPNQKYEEISGLMNKLKKVQQLTALEGIGIKVNQKMEEFKAKLIPSPILELGNKNTIDRGKEANFNLFNKPIFASKHDINLAIIYQRGTDVRQALDVLQRTSKNLSVRLTLKNYQVDRISVPKIEGQLERAINDEMNICCIILPGNMKTQYKAIKISAVVKHQMVTQVLTDAKLKSKNMQSIATKVLLQIIAKRGNTLWVPKSTCKLQSCMLTAFDSAKLGNSTLLAITATINSTFSSVFSSTALYDNNSARFGKMADLTCNAVNAYVQRNDRPPKELLLFQNSCTGDQVSLFHQLLMQPLQMRLSEAYPQQRIGLTFIMINVKTSERFFLQNDKYINNVDAGTLVSRHIVSPQYDFYIVSQRSTRGTSVPNHYRVIFSNSEVEEGVLQEICFSQCFNYVNWTGSIKVPAIMQYAKKCAKFGAEVLEPSSQVPKELASKLYYV